MKKNKSGRLPGKLIATVVIILLVLSCMIGYSWNFLSGSGYFRVKNIVARYGNAEDLSYLKGKNIFSIDLKYESARILEICPDCSKIRLIRLLPDRIFVDFIKRTPCAFVRLYRYFAVDQDGTLFYASVSPEELGLPVISGLETKIFGPKPGKKYNIRELWVALNIIREIKANRVLKNCRINKIDVTNINNISVFLPFSVAKTEKEFENLEVKLGADKIKDKINILSDLIIATKNDLSNIKYIDLRFKEPVIKLKDAK